MKNPITLLTATLIAFILCSTYLRNITCPCNASSISTSAIVGASSLLVSNDGTKKEAPLKINVKPSKEFVFHFKYNRKYVIDVGTMTELKAYLQQNPNNSIAVTGHTDDIGDEAYNQRLSEERAQFIMSQLIREGIDAKQISTVGNGEKMPTDTNKTAQGRYQNRRAVVQIFG
jgi:outer membrane protein OmpA-like peptidoglycan-associated protein